MTAPLWLPGADRVEGNAGGSLVGGAPRWTWHTTEGSSIAGAISAYRKANSWPTLTWDPVAGHIVQHLPSNVAARSLENPPGGVETNRQGKLHVQVEVVGYATKPFTAGPMRGFDRLAAWWRAQGVPDAWPVGGPLPYPRSYGLDNGQRHAGLWVSHGGHYAHSQVPENHHGDCGAIDTGKWAQPGHPVQHPAATHPAVAPQWPFGAHDYLGTARRDSHCHSGVLGGRDATAVKTWQARMHARGWAVSVDGKFGDQSAKVAAQFGREKGARHDGLVDSRLWALAWTAPVK